MVKEILMSSNYWVLNKNICKEYGFEPAIILGVFAEAEKLKGDADGWFFQTSKTIKDITGLSNYQQTKAIQKLIDKNILIQKNKGIPMKRYFKINYEVILNQVFKKLKNCNSKNLKTNIEKTSNNKELTYKELTYKELNNKVSIFENILASLENKTLKEKIEEFIQYRKDIKKPIKTDRPIKSMLNKIGTEFINTEHLMDCIDYAMDHEYQGVKGDYVKLGTKKDNNKCIKESYAQRMLREQGIDVFNEKEAEKIKEVQLID